MDASKRTKHTNACFTGIGKVKRIVLFDTLIEKMDRDEILSVIAHEAGHWKRRHILKQLFFMEVIALVVMYIAFRIHQGDHLSNLHPHPLYVVFHYSHPPVLERIRIIAGLKILTKGRQQKSYKQICEGKK